MSMSFVSEESSVLEEDWINWWAYIPFFEKTNVLVSKSIKIGDWDALIYTLVPMMKAISEEICKDNDY